MKFSKKRHLLWHRTAELEASVELRFDVIVGTHITMSVCLILITLLGSLEK